MAPVSLSKSSFSSKTPQAVAFGQRRLLETGGMHLHHEQGTGATLQPLKHVHSSSKLGNSLQIGPDWTQLHTGASCTGDRKLRHLLAGAVTVSALCRPFLSEILITARRRHVCIG
jgi:hypothetical protein